MPFRRTKIVATLGPASNSPVVLEQLILAGLNVARLNFSHGSPEEHKARARLVRELATGRFVAQGENVLLFGAPGVGKPISRLRSAGRSSKLRKLLRQSLPSRSASAAWTLAAGIGGAAS